MQTVQGYAATTQIDRHTAVEGKAKREIQRLRDKLPKTVQDNLPSQPSGTLNSHRREWKEWRQAVQQSKREVRQERKEKIREQLKQNKVKWRTSLRHKLDTDAKRAHRQIFRPVGEQQTTLTSTEVSDELGNITVHTDPTLVREDVAAHFENTTTDHNQPTQPNKIPCPIPERCFPKPKGPTRDDFGSEVPWAVFQSAIRNMRVGSAPGDDDIENHVICWAGLAIHRLLHRYINLVFTVGKIPTDWKKYKVILLHKRGNSRLIKNWRPIALGRCLYRLWSRIFSSRLTTFTERHHLQHPTQEGFRPKRSTVRQAQKLLNTIAHSTRTKSPLYIAYIDFTNAFGSSTYGTLIWIMEQMGFPPSALERVTDMYTGVKYFIDTPMGKTRWIPMEKGTRQGCSCSPILWDIVLTPFLYWIHSQPDGYPITDDSATKPPRKGQHKTLTRTAALCFADDQAIMAPSKAQLNRILHKLHQFCSWAELTVNRGKTVATGHTFHKKLKTPIDDCTGLEYAGEEFLYQPENPNGLQCLHRTAAFKYLGFWISLSQQWTKLVQTNKEKMKTRRDAIEKAPVHIRQTIRLVHSVLNTSPAYLMPTGAFTQGDLNGMDAMAARPVKKAAGLGTTANKLAAQAPHGWGLGLGSLRRQYAIALITQMEHSLNDHDPSLSTALLHNIKHLSLSKGLDDWLFHYAAPTNPGRSQIERAHWWARHMGHTIAIHTGMCPDIGPGPTIKQALQEERSRDLLDTRLTDLFAQLRPLWEKGYIRNHHHTV